MIWKEEDELTHSLVKIKEWSPLKIDAEEIQFDDIFNEDRLGPNTRKSNEFVT